MAGQIVNLSQFKARLNKLSDGVRGQLLENACLAGALVISNKAKENITDNGQVVTGTMRRSVHVGNHVSESAPGFTPNDEAGTYSDIGGKKITSHSATLLIGTNLEYAPYQEFGTSKMTGKPFLRPALDSEKDNVKKAVEKAVKILIKKATV
jgi:HK97 gp10 family phage protein